MNDHLVVDRAWEAYDNAKEIQGIDDAQNTTFDSGIPAQVRALYHSLADILEHNGLGARTALEDKCIMERAWDAYNAAAPLKPNAQNTESGQQPSQSRPKPL